MPDDITTLFPLAAETPEAILARMVADMNAGIDPSDPLYADVVPGSVWDDLSRSDVLEMDRLYDRMLTEVPAAALPATATGTWLDQWADAVGLERKDATYAGGAVTFTGPPGTAIAPGVQVSTEAPTPDSEPVTFQTTSSGVIPGGGTLDISVQATAAGSAGNVPANAVTILDTPLDGVTVTNALAITSGSDVETDESLQGRVVKKLRGTNGAGNVDYYANLALNYPGVYYVTVQPNTPTIGHVTVMISDVNGDPSASDVIAGLQEVLDPSATPGQGAGLAAPGATVIVTAPVALIVTVDATLALDTGYSLDGTSGTISVTADITDAIVRYFHTLGVGDDVIHNKVLAAIIDIDGVDDVTALTLNGAGGNVVVDATHSAEVTLPLTLT